MQHSFAWIERWFAWIKQWFAWITTIKHPDEDTQRRGRIVVILSLGVMVMVIASLVLVILTPTEARLFLTIVPIFSLSLYSFTIWLARKGYVTISGMLICTSIILVTLGTILSAGKMNDLPFYFILGLLIGGMVLRPAQIWLLLLFPIVSLGLITVVLPTALSEPLGSFVFFDTAMLLGITALLSFLGGRSTTNAVIAAQRARRDAETAADELERVNSALEIRVAERTCELAQALDAQRSQAQELQELLESQQRLNALVAELSVPVVPVLEDVLVVPLVGTLDADRTDRLLTRVLERIHKQRTRAVLIDLTGMAVVDTQVAQALLRTADATRLLGTETVLVGIRPEVAQSLVSLGVNLAALRTAATLQAGLATWFLSRSLSSVVHS